MHLVKKVLRRPKVQTRATERESERDEFCCLVEGARRFSSKTFTASMAVYCFILAPSNAVDAFEIVLCALGTCAVACFVLSLRAPPFFRSWHRTHAKLQGCIAAALNTVTCVAIAMCVAVTKSSEQRAIRAMQLSLAVTTSQITLLTNFSPQRWWLVLCWAVDVTAVCLAVPNWVTTVQRLQIGLCMTTLAFASAFTALESLKCCFAAHVTKRDEEKSARNSYQHFMSQILHDIGTPVSCIAYISEALQTSMQSRPRDYQLPQLATTLEASAAYILMLRDNALDVARQAITGRNPTPKAERINIREVISKQIVPIFREYAKMKETVELSFSVEPSVPEEILTDRRWLSQMIFNYLTNAIKFTVDGYVRLKVRTDKYDSGKICLFVEVEDTGVGVSNEDKEKLFKPFSQVGSAAQQAMGTGLGLNGVRQKARNLGGECGVRDNVPVGAVFWFRIPYLPTDDDLQHMQNPLLADTFDISSVPGNVSRDILVVEDEVVLQKLTCRLVTSFGLSAVPVRTAAHALERMQVSTFLAVLCDLTLSDTSGADVVKEQQRREAAKESPPQVIFIVSGTVRQEDFDAAIAAGAVGTASKPLMKGKFVEFLHAALSIQLERNRKRTHTSTAVHTKKLAHIKSPNRTMNRKGSLLGRIAAVQPDQSFNVPEVLPKILLIDKNDTLRRSAAAKLLFLGCYVKEADGGCQGLEMLQQEVFDLALVDLKLPVMDGFRVISEFRKWEKLSRTTYIPIFAMSAGPTAYDVERSLRLGADEFFCKPVDMRSMLLQIKSFKHTKVTKLLGMV